MAIDERRRHELFTQAQGALGPAAAETLMELLPPVGWADVATKHDLAELEQRIDLRFDLSEQRILATLRGEMAALRSELSAHIRSGQAWTIMAMIAISGVLVAAIRI